MTRDVKVLIVGAGIGGLTTAVALQRAGVDVTVLERAPQLREVGAGISLWPNAVNALRRIGLGDAAEAGGVRVQTGELRDWRGTLLHSSSMQQTELRFGAPLVMIHRAELHHILVSAVDAGCIRPGAHCTVVEQSPTGVRVRLADGTDLHADVVIGADGLGSMVRASVLDNAPPRYSGLTAWRSVTTVEPDVAEQVGSESWGHGAMFGAQRLPGNQVYWYAAVRRPEQTSTVPARDVEYLLGRFGAWHDPIPALINATDAQALLRHGLYDRPAPTTLASGRIALVGDAAHPMLPSLGQGACQAIQDGVTLAEAMGATPDPETALRRYSEQRLEQAATAVKQSRLMSRVAHVRSPVAAALRNALLRRASPQSTLDRLAPVLDSTPYVRDPGDQQEAAT